MMIWPVSINLPSSFSSFGISASRMFEKRTTMPITFVFAEFMYITVLAATSPPPLLLWIRISGSCSSGGGAAGISIGAVAVGIPSSRRDSRVGPDIPESISTSKFHFVPRASIVSRRLHCSPGGFLRTDLHFCKPCFVSTRCSSDDASRPHQQPLIHLFVILAARTSWSGIKANTDSTNMSKYWNGVLPSGRTLASTRPGFRMSCQMAASKNWNIFTQILRPLSFKDSLIVWIVMLCVNCHQKRVILLLLLRVWNVLMAWMMPLDARGTFWTSSLLLWYDSHTSWPILLCVVLNPNVRAKLEQNVLYTSVCHKRHLTQIVCAITGRCSPWRKPSCRQIRGRNLESFCRWSLWNKWKLDSEIMFMLIQKTGMMCSSQDKEFVGWKILN